MIRKISIASLAGLSALLLTLGLFFAIRGLFAVVREQQVSEAEASYGFIGFMVLLAAYSRIRGSHGSRTTKYLTSLSTLLAGTFRIQTVQVVAAVLAISLALNFNFDRPVKSPQVTPSPQLIDHRDPQQVKAELKIKHIEPALGRHNSRPNREDITEYLAMESRAMRDPSIQGSEQIRAESQMKSNSDFDPESEIALKRKELADYGLWRLALERDLQQATEDKLELLHNQRAQCQQELARVSQLQQANIQVPRPELPVSNQGSHLTVEISKADDLTVIVSTTPEGSVIEKEILQVLDHGKLLQSKIDGSSLGYAERSIAYLRVIATLGDLSTCEVLSGDVHELEIGKAYAMRKFTPLPEKLP